MNADYTDLKEDDINLNSRIMTIVVSYSKRRRWVPESISFSDLCYPRSSVANFVFVGSLHFPKHQVFEKCVMRSKARDGESGEAVAKTSLQ
jgi:hypothetical protein